MDCAAVASRIGISRRPGSKFERNTPGSVDEHFDLLFTSLSVKRTSQCFVVGEIREFAIDLHKAASHRDSRKRSKEGRGHPDLPHDQLPTQIGPFASEINLQLLDSILPSSFERRTGPPYLQKSTTHRRITELRCSQRPMNIVQVSPIRTCPMPAPGAIIAALFANCAMPPLTEKNQMLTEASNQEKRSSVRFPK